VWASIAAVAAGAALAVVWPLVGFASSGHTAATLGSSTLIDATGDALNGGPDIGTVEINDDTAGKISFTAPIVNRPELTDVDAVQAFFDTDKSSATGGVGGFEYEVAWIQGHQLFLKWDGAQFVSADAKSFSAAYKDGKATFSIDKADFGGSVAFNLVVTTTGDNGDSTSDRGPNTGVWTHPSQAGPQPPPPPPPPPPPAPPGGGGGKLAVSKVTVGQPHSGATFTVSMVVKVSSTGIAVKSTVTCSAKLAGKTLKASKKGSVQSGKATCSWKIPKKSKGKQLKVSITSSYKGAKVTRSFSKRVLS
jgi:hypothetical protein